ncbi:MAG: putative ubiquitin carboxyl-terminal hydrolase 5, partial [Streblomastix strix]
MDISGQDSDFKSLAETALGRGALSKFDDGQSAFLVEADFLHAVAENIEVKIDNSKLLDPSTQRFIDSKKISEDFGVIMHDGWKRLLEHYGGGPAIEREVVSVSGITKMLDKNPMRLGVSLKKSTDKGSSTTKLQKYVQINKYYTDQKILFAIAHELQFPDHCNFRIWTIGDSPRPFRFTRFADFKSIIGDADAIQVELVDTSKEKTNINYPDPWNVGEVKQMMSQEGGYASQRTALYCQGYEISFNEEERKLQFDPRYGNSNYGQQSNITPPEFRGLVGLQSLGNTCYMNSALQCLLHTPLLASFFLSGKYKQEIVKENKLGTQGQIAEAFAYLMKQIWGFGCKDKDKDQKKEQQKEKDQQKDNGKGILKDQRQQQKKKDQEKDLDYEKGKGKENDEKERKKEKKKKKKQN